MVINKIDILPYGLKINKLKHWVRMQIDQYYPELVKFINIFNFYKN